MSLYNKRIVTDIKVLQSSIPCRRMSLDSQPCSAAARSAVRSHHHGLSLHAAGLASAGQQWF